MVCARAYTQVSECMYISESHIYDHVLELKLDAATYVSATVSITSAIDYHWRRMITILHFPVSARIKTFSREKLVNVFQSSRFRLPVNYLYILVKHSNHACNNDGT